MRHAFIGLLLLPMISWSQSLTLEQCQQQARLHYPLIKQRELITQSRDFTLANARSGYLPQVTLNGQATYQSDVTSVPVSVPGLSIESLSKDQYKVFADISQTLYDGGAINRQGQLQELGAKVEEQQLDVELYKLEERINQIYFGVLLIDEQLKQLALVEKDIRESLSRVHAAIDHGIAFKSNATVLQAELLKVQQKHIELDAMRAAFLEMLGAFVNAPLGESTTLTKPEMTGAPADPAINRPELTLFNAQSEFLDAQFRFSGVRNLPKIGLFLQAGYGKPALNLLENRFDTYYLGGIRFTWGLGGLYNQKREQQLNTLNHQKLEVQRETFLFNTRLALTQGQKEIEKLQQLLEVDANIIELRRQVKETAQTQLENGVITSNDYLRELNAEDLAVQNKLLHETQLLMAIYNYRYNSGN